MNSHFVPIEADRVYKLLNIGATTLVSACYEENADVMPAAWACALDLVPCKATVVIDKSHFTRHLVEKSGYFALMLPTRAIAKETLYLGSVSKHDDKEKLEKSGAEFFTRHLVEKSGYFALMLPTRAIAKETLYLGSVSKHDDKEKLEKSGAEFFKVDGFDMPLVKDCAAWMIFKVLPTLYLGSVSKHDDKEKLEKSGAEFFKVDGFDMPLVKDCAAWMIFKVLPEPHNEKTYDLFIGECVAAWADDRIYRDGRWLFEKADKNMSTLHYVAGGHFYTMGEPIDVEP